MDQTDSTAPRRRRIVTPAWMRRAPAADVSVPPAPKPVPQAKTARMRARSAPPVAPVCFGSDVFVTNPGALLALLGDDSWPTALGGPSTPTAGADADPGEEPGADADVEVEIDDAAQSPAVRSPAEVRALLREHWRWPEPFVEEIEARLPFHVSPDVLLSAARRGLWAAARRFDPSRGVPFPGFAKQRVTGAIVDELRAERFVLRRHRADAESGHLRALLSACSYDARFDELTEEESAWLAAWRTVSGVRALPVRGERRLAGALDEDAVPADQQIDQCRLFAALEEAVAGLEPVQRRLVEKVAFEGCTIEEAAQPLSKSWGSRLYAAAVATLKRTMVRAGYVEFFAPGALSARSTFRGLVQTGAGSPSGPTEDAAQTG